MEEKLTNFCISLYNIGCLKFGKFTLKSGIESNYYVDLRLIISHPKLLGELCSLFYEHIISKKIEFDTICGVPYTALPMSTLIAVKTNKPMVLRRKEAKGYGTEQLVDGMYKKGNICIIIEDVISSGSSIMETIADIESVGLIVKDVIAVFNREEGGTENIKTRGYNVHCLFSLSKTVHILKNRSILTEDLAREIENQKNMHKSPSSKLNRTKMTYEKRIEHCRSTVAARLLSIMVQKKTNLCLSADVTNMNDLLKLANDVGPHICIFKTHIDIISSCSEKDKDSLKKIAIKHNFLIMEDRKLSDIGNTVRLQFNQISSWANLVTAHSLPGFDVLEGIKNSEMYNKDVGVFLIAEISSKHNLITPEYTKKSLALADAYPELVAGIVCQFSTAIKHPGYIQMTPGGNIEKNMENDKYEQQNNSPKIVITNRGADIAVVGRGIINSDNPIESAKEYRNQLWEAYLARL